MNNKKDIDFIYKKIIEHLEILGGKHVTKLDLEIENLLLHEALEALISYYKKADSKEEKKHIKEMLLKVHTGLTQDWIKVRNFDTQVIRLENLIIFD